MNKLLILKLLMTFGTLAAIYIDINLIRRHLIFPQPAVSFYLVQAMVALQIILNIFVLKLKDY